MKESVIFDSVKKDLRKVPLFVLRNLQRWALMIEKTGISEVRKIPGYHDEPLKGTRKGQRSIRLSKGYRAIYIEYNDKAFHIIRVEKVSKHEY